MKLLKAAAIVVIGLTVSGCASIENTATRNAPFSPEIATAPALSQIVDVTDVNVNVSRDLRVSEAEVYYPMADIVWRGDAPGDRYEQVGAIFETSAQAATGDLDQGPQARVDIDVTRFHSLTNKTRYTVGGVHSINFVLSVKDPETGVDLIAPRKIKADLKGYGGQQATMAEARGETQKKRITEHLTRVIREELSGGIVAAEQAANETVSRNETFPPDLTSVY